MHVNDSAGNLEYTSLKFKILTFNTWKLNIRIKL